VISELLELFELLGLFKPLELLYWGWLLAKAGALTFFVGSSRKLSEGGYHPHHQPK
jgi:hypothetical protein